MKVFRRPARLNQFDENELAGQWRTVAALIIKAAETLAVEGRITKEELRLILPVLIKIGEYLERPRALKNMLIRVGYDEANGRNIFKR